MLTKDQFHNKIAEGIRFLDGATGSNLRRMGMPNHVCTEQWILSNPESLVSLQRKFAQAGCHILYAPTFQAQPIALEKVGLDKHCQQINAQLVALSRCAAPECLIAGDLTTLAAFTESWNPDNFDLLVDNYRQQIQGLMDGGADLLIAETLIYPLEAEAILAAAEMENAGALMFSFTMMSDGSLYSGEEAAPVLRDLEEAGAAAVGFNCVTADMMTPYLVTKLRRWVKGPLICKPNAGIPRIDEAGMAQYDMTPDAFASVLADCCDNGATLLGGCCGATPEHMQSVISCLRKKL